MLSAKVAPEESIDKIHSETDGKNELDETETERAERLLRVVRNTCSDVKDSEIDQYGKNKRPQISFRKVYANCSRTEKCILYVGFLASVFTGLCMPVWIIVFGQVIDEFDSTAMFDMKPEEVFDSVKFMAMIMLIFGTFSWLFAFV